jgi:hypothetical protein
MGTHCASTIGSSRSKTCSQSNLSSSGPPSPAPRLRVFGVGRFATSGGVEAMLCGSNASGAVAINALAVTVVLLPTCRLEDLARLANWRRAKMTGLPPEIARRATACAAHSKDGGAAMAILLPRPEKTALSP